MSFPHPVLVILMALQMGLWFSGCGDNSGRMIQNIVTDKGTYLQKVRSFKSLCKRRNPLVTQFLIEVARDPYICFNPGFRQMGSEASQASATETVEAFPALAIESLPEEQDAAILAALVINLGVTTQGRYSERTFYGTFECRTEPVRDLARKKLVAITGQDCEYDTAKWELLIYKKYGIAVPPENSVAPSPRTTSPTPTPNPAEKEN